MEYEIFCNGLWQDCGTWNDFLDRLSAYLENNTVCDCPTQGREGRHDDF